MAVVGVLLYHGDIPGVAAGGFLGVDVFFTLSGFLITSLLLREFERTGRIGIGAFYLRRARRLLPAMLAMLVACAWVAPVWAPETVQRLRADIPAALVYLSNWWQIVSEQSYFETFGRAPLLQHLWSLAIEEQFYLLWPVLVWWLLKVGGVRGLKWLGALMALAVTGWMAFLAVSLGVPADADPNRLYLASDTHVMGLLAGVWLACAWNPWSLLDRHSRPASWWTRDAVGVLGIAGLLWCYVGLHEGSPWLYRGGFLLVSVLSLGVLLAACDGRTRVSQLLELPPLRWLGTRSYGLYLWHWPIFVLLRPGEELPADPWLAFGIRLLVTVAIAELCLVLLENPIRQGRLAIQGAGRWGLAACAGVLMLGSTWNLYLVVRPSVAPVSAALGSLVTDEGMGAFVASGQALLHGSTARDAPSSANGVPEAAEPARLTAVGDSVLLGAGGHLMRLIAGTQVDAEVGRQGGGGLQRVRELKASGALADTVMLHLGTNGYLYQGQVEELLSVLSDRQRVIVMTVHAARRWTDANNRILRRAVEGRPNVALVDWYQLSLEHPEYFVKDGVHLTGPGIRAYAEQIRLAGRFPARSVPVVVAQREAWIAHSEAHGLARRVAAEPAGAPAPGQGDDATPPEPALRPEHTRRPETDPPPSGSQSS